MNAVGIQPAPVGNLSTQKIIGNLRPLAGLIRDELYGHYYKAREPYLLKNKRQSTWQYNLLCWLRDHINRNIPRMYYRLMLGHDLHTSAYVELYVRHYHASERDPFNPEKIGWWENVG